MRLGLRINRQNSLTGAELPVNGKFIIAPHSPILLMYLDATNVSFDDSDLPQLELADTPHHQITRGIRYRATECIDSHGAGCRETPWPLQPPLGYAKHFNPIS